MSPSGQTVLELILWHESVVREAGLERTLSFAAPAKAVGSVAERLHQAGEGAYRFTGFAAPRRSARSREDMQSSPPAGLIFHITEFEMENQDGLR